MTDQKNGFWAKVGLGDPVKRSWAYYDVANSAFATTIMVAVLPTYFADVIAEPLAPHERSSLWAYITAGTMAIAALLSPVLGALADRRGSKKVQLFWWTLLGCLCSGLLYFMGKGDYQMTALLFGVGSVAFLVANVFYEALLPSLCSDEEIHLTSTAGYALGYLGGGVLLVINLLMIMKPELFGLADGGVGVRLSFVSVAVWWLLWSIPLFRFVPEPWEPENQKAPFMEAMISSFRGLWHTLRDLKRYRNAFIFLVAFWAYSDGIGTIMKMATIYGKEVGIGTSELVAAIVMVQFLGVPFSFLFGGIAHKVGAKPALIASLVVYTLCSIGAYWMATALHFFLVAGAVAMVQGAAQAISRSLYAQMTPTKKAGEFFGFFSISSKFAGVIGPLMFGVVSSMAGGSQLAIAMVAGLFMIGIVLLLFVDVEAGKREAEAT